MKRGVELLKNLLVLLFILASSLFVSYLLYVWYGYPRGNDAVSHLFRIKYILDFFPRINWIHAWAGGMPMFSLYPSLPYLLMALVQKISGFSLGVVLAGTAVVFGVGLSSFAIYLLVKSVSKSSLAAILASLIYLTTPGVWSIAFSGGLYARALAIPFLVFTLYFLVNYVFDTGERKKKLFVFAVFSLGATFLFHYTVGAVALVSSLVILLLFSPNWTGIKESLKLSFLSLAVAGSLLVPFIGKGASVQRLLESDFMERIYLLRTPLSRLLSFLDLDKSAISAGDFLNPAHWLRSSPSVVPLFLTLLLLLIIFRRKILSKPKSILISYLTLMAAGWLFYTTVVFPFIKFSYYFIGGPEVGLFYLPIFASIGVGVMLVEVFRGIWSKFLSLFLIFAIFGWFVFQFGVVWKKPSIGYVKEVRFDDVVYQFTREIIPDKNQFNFRIGDGNDNGTIASWLNIEYPLVPQTRDYFFQGVVNPDYYAQKDYVIWHENGNYKETDFLLDWWGVQQFLVNRDSPVLQKFIAKPQYVPLGGSIIADAYKFAFATPILSATSTEAVLIVGKGAYDPVFRGLARGNFNSTVVIPVHGKDFIDEYKIDELEHFKTVFLYNYSFFNRENAQGLLKKFVEDGGRLVIESNVELEKSGSLTDPYPIFSAERGEIKDQWNFGQGENVTFKFPDLGKFGPAVFNNGPWGISKANGIKNWARPILFSGNIPILVAGKLGKGEVIWSGMNLPFHTNLYNSSEEARLLTMLLLGKEVAVPGEGQTPSAAEGELVRTKTYHIDKAALSNLVRTQDGDFKTDEYKSVFVNPEEREVFLNKPVSGILFKEFYTSNWNAFLVGSKQKLQLPIYKAGPDFMYVPLGPVEVGSKVVLKYGKTPLERVGEAISIFTVVGIILYLFDWWIFKKYVIAIKTRLTSPFRNLTRWWKSEEE